MQNSQVSFQSKIKIMPKELFLNDVAQFPYFSYVDAPWTFKEVARDLFAATDGIKTCTAGGILVAKDSNHIPEIVMFHIDPSEVANDNFKKIEEMIWDKIGTDNPIQGFLLGSKKYFKPSVDMFAKFEEFMHKLRIPYSKFQGIPAGNADYSNLAYNANKDEWSVYASALTKINKRELLQNFDEVVLSHKDKLVMERDR